MRCFYVLVHGILVWHSSKLATDVIGADGPDGFWCHRFVLADDEKAAENKPFLRLTANLERELGWLSSGVAEVVLKLAEVSLATVVKLLRPDNRGFTYYRERNGS